MKTKIRVFGYAELIFDSSYLLMGLGLGLYMLIFGRNTAQTLAGVMGIILVVGDSFHLLPRIAAIIHGDSRDYQKAMGIGKLVASITMTIFYSILWNIGLLLFSPPKPELMTTVVVALAIIRICLCLLPQNRWTAESPPLFWGILRNIPFLLQGLVVGLLFWSYRNMLPHIGQFWLSILLSFIFYIPVVLWADKYPKIGMLMLPKTIMYIWMLLLCLKI